MIIISNSTLVPPPLVDGATVRGEVCILGGEYQGSYGLRDSFPQEKA